MVCCTIVYIKEFPARAHESWVAIEIFSGRPPGSSKGVAARRPVVPQAFPGTVFGTEKNRYGTYAKADPNPRFRLFGSPESRFASVFGQGKGALWIPKPWVRCCLIRIRKTFLWQSNFCASVREVPLYNGAPCHADSILKAFTTFSRMYVSRIIAYLWVPRAQPQVCLLLPFHPS